METAYKNRWLFWLLIFLIIVNLSALATYFLLPEKQPQQACGIDSGSPNCIMHEQLNLTEVQNVLVDSINAAYQKVSRPVSLQIKDLRAAILDELERQDPDTLLINSLAEEISDLQLQMHRNNINHYLELKKVCDRDQALRLSNLYREVYGCPMDPDRNQGKQHRHRGK